MFSVFQGRTADDAWLALARAFRSPDVPVQQSRAGLTREIFRAAVTVADPRQRWVVSREPPLNPAFALAEVVWILAGRNDAEFLTFFNRQLPQFCGTDAVCHGAYGHRLRRHFGLDQLGRAVDALARTPDSRQVCLQLWDLHSDFPFDDGAPAAADIPCNVMTLLKVRNGGLELTEILRSNDVFRGLPYNLVQFTTLQEVLAGWLGVGIGSYAQVVDSVHVYEDAFEYVVSAPDSSCANANTDSLHYPRAVSEPAFFDVARLVDRVRTGTIKGRELVNAPGSLDSPLGFRNIAFVLCAEAARRLEGVGLACEVMSGCTNPVFQQLWTRWIGRVAPSPVRVARG